MFRSILSFKPNNVLEVKCTVSTQDRPSNLLNRKFKYAGIPWIKHCNSLILLELIKQGNLVFLCELKSKYKKVKNYHSKKFHLKHANH